METINEYEFNNEIYNIDITLPEGSAAHSCQWSAAAPMCLMEVLHAEGCQKALVHKYSVCKKKTKCEIN